MRNSGWNLTFLPGENTVLKEYFKKKSYTQLPMPNDSPMVPATPETYFLTPPATVEQPKLKPNFFHNWKSSSDWKKSDLPMMNPEEREKYEHHLLMTRSKYFPMTEEDVTKLTPQDQEEYQKTFKIKTPRYSLRSRPY